MGLRKKIDPLFVTYIPDNMEDGKLYISVKYATAIHKCCCGCGKEVVTPLGDNGWRLIQKKGKISLSPSIGNWQYECKTHYFIKNNKIIWLNYIPSMGEKKKDERSRYSLRKQLLRFYQYIKRLF